MAQTNPSLEFSLIFVLDQLSPANSGGLNFRKYTPLDDEAKLKLIFMERSFFKLAYALLYGNIELFKSIIPLNP